MNVRFFVFFLDITYIFAMSLMKKDKKHAKHIGVDKIRHINRFCLHMSEKCSTFVGGMRISIAYIFSQANPKNYEETTTKS